MSDRVALDEQSTFNERMRDRNVREPFLNRAQAHLAPKLPVFESRHMPKRSCKRTSLMITHNDQTTYQTNYQTIHFKHNNNIAWTKNSPGKQFKQDMTN